jgi:RNA polymerase sigma-70 factor (ECF subfamily)
MPQEDLVRLVERAKGGDGAASGELVRLLRGTVFAVALRWLRDHAEADDLTQDVFIHGLSRLAQVRQPACLPAWLRRTAVRRAINRLRRRRDLRPLPPDGPGAPLARDPEPLDVLVAVERATTVRHYLARLRPLDRDTLVAFYFRGRTLAQMTGDFAAPLGTVKRRLYTARRHLRDKLCSAGLNS